MGFGKMFRAVAALLWGIVIPGAGIAQGTLPDVVPNKPIPGDPMIDYRIEACSGTYGFGPYLYAPSDHIIRFSDFCLLEDQGVALAAEELSGLTLTKDGPNFRLFEDLPSGDERYARNNVSFLFGEGTEECESSEPRNAFEYTIPNAEALRAWISETIGVALFPPEVFFLSELPSKTDPVEVTFVVALALILSFAASLYPAWRAAQYDPVEALRYG